MSAAQNDHARAQWIEARGLTRSFGDRPVLRHVNLLVEDGSFVAVVGRSGCGKSTLLRLIAGLDAPTSGEVRFRGGSRARVRLMYQEPRLLPWATVLDNVAVGLGETGTTATRRKQAEAALGSVGLNGRGGDWPAVLSGGQRQRVALARALVSAPQVLLLDEPLGALDALTRIGMQSLLEEVWIANGFTAVMVTHDVAEAVALADRVILIENGVIAREWRNNLPRPRQRGSAAFAALEGEILDELLAEHAWPTAGQIAS